MTSSFHDRVQAVFFDALDHPKSNRIDLVKRRAQGDLELEREVCKLLDTNEAADDRLDQPPLVAGLSGLLDAPKSIGGYAVVRTLGEGGMGVVYEAQQTNPKRPVAIKLMRFGGSEEALRRFRYEAEVLGFLQHEAIAHVYESGVTGPELRQQPYFSMEYVPGLPIDEYVAETELDHESIAHLMIRVLDGIHHAHQKGVVHRDIKPANILVRDDGQPKVLDFGIARIADLEGDRSMATATGQVMGTLAYMSPEQVTARPEEIDTRADVYAMGVLMFELISGERPIDVGDVGIPTALRRIVEDAPKNLGTVAPATPNDLATIVHKALAKDKERRYSSAEALADDLRRFIAKEPIRARPPSRSYLIKRFVQRNRTTTLLTSLAVLSLVGGAIALKLSNTELQEANALAKVKTEEAESRLSQLTRSTDLLQDVLGEPLPFEDGAELTFGTVVSRASTQVIEGFRQEPEQRVWLATSLGGTALQISLLDRASLLIEAAEQSLEEVENPAPILVMKVRYLAADFQYASQNYAAAEAAFAALLPKLDDFDGPGADSMRVSIDGKIGECRLRAGDFDGAKAGYEKMLAEALALDADPRMFRVDAMIGLAHLQMRAGDFAGAADTASTVLVVLDESGEGKTGARSRGLNLLGAAYLNLNDLDQSRVAFKEALDIERSNFGEGHPLTGVSAGNLASLERRAGNLDESLALYSEAVDALETAGEAKLEEYAAMLSNRGSLRAIIGDIDGGMKDLLFCEEVLAGVEGLTAASTRAWCKTYMGSAEADRGNYAKAKEHLNAALAKKADVFQMDAHPEMSWDLEELAEIHKELAEHRAHASASLKVAQLRGQFLGPKEPGRLNALKEAEEALAKYRTDASFEAGVAAELEREIEKEKGRE